MIGKNDGVYESGDEQRERERTTAILWTGALKIRFIYELLDAYGEAESDRDRARILKLLEGEWRENAR